MKVIQRALDFGGVSVMLLLYLTLHIMFWWRSRMTVKLALHGMRVGSMVGLIGGIKARLGSL